MLVKERKDVLGVVIQTDHVQFDSPIVVCYGHLITQLDVFAILERVQHSIQICEESKVDQNSGTCYLKLQVFHLRWPDRVSQHSCPHRERSEGGITYIIIIHCGGRGFTYPLSSSEKLLI